MVKTLTRPAARIYGTLSALGNGSFDVLERLLPFFEPLLRPKQGEIFNLADFASEVRETYSWNFNTDIVEAFIPRLVDAEWLTRTNPEIAQSPYIISLPDREIETESQSSTNDQLRETAEIFKPFSLCLSPLTAIPKDVEEYEDILIEQLLYIEAFSEKHLEFKTSFKVDEDGTLRQTVEVPQITSLKDEERFLCARFVQLKRIQQLRKYWRKLLQSAC